MAILSTMRVEVTPLNPAELDALYQLLVAKGGTDITVTKDDQRGLVYFVVNHTVDA